MRECAQCEGELPEDATANQKYCVQSCRWDHSNGMAPEVSRRRRETGFAWDPVRPARKVEVKVPQRLAQGRGAGGSSSRSTSTWRTALVLPDPQIGYRRLADGRLDPFHDARAIDIAMQITEAERPDLTVWLGDFLDFPMFGRFRLEAEFAQTAQPALEYAHELLAKTTALSGETRLIEGNHDARLQNFIVDNAMAAAGLRRARSISNEWPVLSVPYLLRLEELGVEYVGGYPAGATYINDNLAAIHGHIVAPAGQTAAKVVADEQVSTIFGHVHRIETAHRTRNSRGAPRFNVAHTPGCLCRIDGAVPSVRSSKALKTGRPAKSWENWNQGLAVVRYQLGGDQKFVIESVPIYEGWALHRGQEFTSNLGVNDG